MTARLSRLSARLPVAVLLALATLAALPASQASAAAPAPTSSSLPWAAVAFAGVHRDAQGHVDAAVVGVMAVVFQPRNRVKGKTDPAVLATLKTASLAALSELGTACGYDGSSRTGHVYDGPRDVYVNGDPVNLADPSGHNPYDQCRGNSCDSPNAAMRNGDWAAACDASCNARIRGLNAAPAKRSGCSWNPLDSHSCEGVIGQGLADLPGAVVHDAGEGQDNFIQNFQNGGYIAVGVPLIAAGGIALGGIAVEAGVADAVAVAGNAVRGAVTRAVVSSGARLSLNAMRLSTVLAGGGGGGAAAGMAARTWRRPPMAAATNVFRASAGGSGAVTTEEALAAASRVGGGYFDAASVELRYAAPGSPEYFAETAGHTSLYGNGEPLLNGTGQFLIHIQDEGLVSSQEGALTVLHELMHIANPAGDEADVEAAARTIFGGG